jgi:hypothetical protein
MNQRRVTLILGIALVSCVGAVAEEEADQNSIAAASTHIGAPTSSLVEPGTAVKKTDSCRLADILPNSPPLTWDTQAETTQCGALEIDDLGIQQSLRGGLNQQLLATTAKYGLTPRMEVRWGAPGRVMQRNSAGNRLSGTSDQWLGVCYRFLDQQRWSPDLALDYAIKVPSANPAKRFGTGYTDHQLTFVASHDAGRTHMDFNIAGTIAGSIKGRDGAAQFGLAVSQAITSRLTGTIEGYGGPQPGTSDRFGAVVIGTALSMRPSVALNGAYARTFTAGDPKKQILIGVVYTLRPRLSALPGISRFARLLGR